jgi:CRISPR-associated protein Cmr5
MNRQKIDEMIIKAMEIIASNEVEILEQNKVPSQYIGYIASFGPSVVQTGLIQTVAFYSKNDEQNPRKSNEEKSRKKVLDLMEKTLVATHRMPSSENNLLHYLNTQWKQNLNNFNQRIQLKNIVMEACTACKLALRTFEIKKEK